MNSKPWTPVEIAELRRLRPTHTFASIAVRLGRTHSSCRCAWRRIVCGQRMGYYTTQGVADALGAPWGTVRAWIQAGQLAGLGGDDGRCRRFTAAHIRDALHTGIALSHSLRPTAPMWIDAVAQARAELRCRLVRNADVAVALSVHLKTISEWRTYRGFPRGVLQIRGGERAGLWIERAAVVTWLDKHPQHWTSAARRLLETANGR